MSKKNEYRFNKRFDETDEAGLNAFVDVLIRFL